MWEIPNKSYETLYRECITDDPPLKNIATDVSASPLWECGKCINGRQDSGRYTFQKRPSCHNGCKVCYKGWWLACPCGSQTSPSKAGCPRMITERCIWSWTTQTYQLYLSQPTSRDLPCLRDEDVFWSSEVAALHGLGLRHVQEETDGNRSWAVQTVCPWKLWQSHCGIWWIHSDSMHQRLCTLWDELATKWGLQCISLSSWSFEPKRRSFCPTKRASVCSLWCFSKV